MTDKDKIEKLIKQFREKMEKTDNNFLKHEYFNCIKNLEEIYKRLDGVKFE